jgi:hypothetical protein
MTKEPAAALKPSMMFIVTPGVDIAGKPRSHRTFVAQIS